MKPVAAPISLVDLHSAANRSRSVQTKYQNIPTRTQVKLAQSAFDSISQKKAVGRKMDRQPLPALSPQKLALNRDVALPFTDRKAKP